MKRSNISFCNIYSYVSFFLRVITISQNLSTFPILFFLKNTP